MRPKSLLCATLIAVSFAFALNSALADSLVRASVPGIANAAHGLNIGSANSGHPKPVIPATRKMNYSVQTANKALLGKATAIETNKTAIEEDDANCGCDDGVFLMEQNKFPEAVKFYQTQIKLPWKNHVRAAKLNNLAWALAHMQNYDEALKYSNLAVGLAKKHVLPFAHGTRGYIYLRKGMYKESVAELNLALKLNSVIAEDWYYLAVNYERLGQFGESERALNTARALDFNISKEEVF